jgi:uncharacterized protein YecE (DUF72 family)
MQYTSETHETNCKHVTGCCPIKLVEAVRRSAEKGRAACDTRHKQEQEHEREEQTARDARRVSLKVRGAMARDARQVWPEKQRRATLDGSIPSGSIDTYHYRMI